MSVQLHRAGCDMATGCGCPTTVPSPEATSNLPAHDAKAQANSGSIPLRAIICARPEVWDRLAALREGSGS